MRRVMAVLASLATASVLVAPEAAADNRHVGAANVDGDGQAMHNSAPASVPAWHPAAQPRQLGQVGPVRRGPIVIRDAAGDGKADLVSLRVWRRSRIPMVNVRVRGVRHLRKQQHFLLIYVDPYGSRRRPSYAFAVELNHARRYGMFRTRGWAIGRKLGTCGESGRSAKPATGVRVIRFQMPMACFGDYGARFAASTLRFNRSGQRLGHRDWTPRKKHLTRTFRF